MPFPPFYLRPGLFKAGGRWFLRPPNFSVSTLKDLAPPPLVSIFFPVSFFFLRPNPLFRWGQAVVARLSRSGDRYLKGGLPSEDICSGVFPSLFFFEEHGASSAKIASTHPLPRSVLPFPRQTFLCKFLLPRRARVQSRLSSFLGLWR